MVPTVVTVSDAERTAGCLRPASVAIAAEALRVDGFVVIERAMEPALLLRLAERMAADLPRAVAEAEARWGGAAHNFVWGNVQQGPVLALPGFCNAEVIANPWALQLLAEVMRRRPGQGLSGPGFSSGVSGNTNLGLGSRTQPVHRDAAHDTPPFTGFVLNYPLSDVDEANGAIEIWPGTHLETETLAAERQRGERWRGNVPPAISEGRRRIAPPVRVTTRLGAVIVRDRNCWHRGMASIHSAPRFMPAIVFSAGEPGATPAKFGHGTEAAIAQAHRNIETVGLGPSFAAAFVTESELSETAKGGCADEDRRYLFPFDTQDAWLGETDEVTSGSNAATARRWRHSTDADCNLDIDSKTTTAEPELPWGRPASVDSPDDNAEGWCEWYWSESRAWMRSDPEEGTLTKGPAAHLQAEAAQRRAAL